MSNAWIFGDDIDTDVLAPGLYMKGPFEELARHCLESVDEKFATGVRPGDIVVAGHNFGIGSSREQAAQALKTLGVTVVIARSFGGIFFRNALNMGLLAVVCDDVARINAGDDLTVDAHSGVIENKTIGETYQCEPLPPQLMEMVHHGGLVAHLELTMKNTKKKKKPS